MDRIIPLRRFLSWLIDRLIFIGIGSAVLFPIRWVRQVGFSGPGEVDLDLYDFVAIQAPLTLLVTYILWFLIIVKFGPPGRRLTGTDVHRLRGWSASLPAKLIRALIKFLLHLTLIGFVVDAIVICYDRTGRRSIPDRVAGTVITRVNRRR